MPAARSRGGSNPILEGADFSERRRGANTVDCMTCGVDLGKSGWTNASPTPIHCTGTKLTKCVHSDGTVHHGTIAWGMCWNCKGQLGCNGCVLTSEDDLLCERCGAWARVEGFLKHGALIPHIRPNGRVLRPAIPFEGYPSEWRSAWEQEVSETIDSVGMLDPEKAFDRVILISRTPDDMESLIRSQGDHLSPITKARMLRAADLWRTMLGKPKKYEAEVADFTEDLTRPMPEVDEALL